MKKLVFSFCLLLILPVQLRAGEGRIPIFEPVLFNTSIDGRYILTQPITGSTSPVIEFNGSGTEQVDLDLNGFSVRLTGTGPAITVTDVRKLVIRNGEVGRISVDSGTAVGAEVVLSDLRVDGGGATGVYAIDIVDAATTRIARVTIENAENGIRAMASTALGGTLEDNVIRAAQVNGIVVDGALGTDMRILGNSVTGPDEKGIKITHGDGFEIAGNSVVSVGSGEAIVVDSSSSGVVADNRISGDATTPAGIFLLDSDDNRIVNNIVSFIGLGGGKTGEAIFLQNSDRNRLQDNVLSRSDVGIRFDATSDGNTYGGNSITTGGGVCPGTTNASPPCGEPEVCDEGSSNESFGDNLAGGASGPC